MTLRFPIKLGLLLSATRLLGDLPEDLSKRFYETIRNNDSAGLAVLLKDPAWKTAKDSSENTPLMYAAEVGTVASFKALVDAGAEVNARNAFQVTPLLLCATEEAKVRLLIAKGADVNARAKSGQTALFIAAMTPGATATVRMLLDAGADLKKSDRSPGATPIVAAAFANDMDTLRFLLDRGASVEVPAGAIALSLAAAHGNAEMMRLLLAKACPPICPAHL